MGSSRTACSIDRALVCLLRGGDLDASRFVNAKHAVPACYVMGEEARRECLESEESTHNAAAGCIRNYSVSFVIRICWKNAFGGILYRVLQ